MTLYDRFSVRRDNNPNSGVIKKLFKSDNESFVKGLTKITIDDDVLQIQHSGRTSHTMSNLNNNLLDSGLGAIERLKKHFVTLTETGSPDYFYVIKFQL